MWVYMHVLSVHVVRYIYLSSSSSIFLLSFLFSFLPPFFLFYIFIFGMQPCMCINVNALGYSEMSSSVTFLIMFWDKGPHWARNSLYWLYKTNNELQGFHYLCSTSSKLIKVYQWSQLFKGLGVLISDPHGFLAVVCTPTHLLISIIFLPLVIITESYRHFNRKYKNKTFHGLLLKHFETLSMFLSICPPHTLMPQGVWLYLNRSWI